MDRSEAPWTDEQVASLNAYQKAGYVHPFTSSPRPCDCGGSSELGMQHAETCNRSEGGIDLIATKDGWVEWLGGPVVQNWAHKFMTDWSWGVSHLQHRHGLNELRKALGELESFHRVMYPTGDSWVNPLADDVVGLLLDRFVELAAGMPAGIPAEHYAFYTLFPRLSMACCRWQDRKERGDG